MLRLHWCDFKDNLFSAQLWIKYKPKLQRFISEIYQSLWTILWIILIVPSSSICLNCRPNKLWPKFELLYIFSLLCIWKGLKKIQILCWFRILNQFLSTLLCYGTIRFRYKYYKNLNFVFNLSRKCEEVTH